MRLEYVKPWADMWRVKYLDAEGRANYVYVPKSEFRDELEVYKWWNHKTKEQTNGNNC